MSNTNNVSPIPCTVYIDEAGDLGINKGTNWFVLSAVIVNSEHENEIRSAMKRIKKTLNVNTIHFRNLRNFEQRCFVVSELTKFPFDIVYVIIDTTKIDITKPHLEKSSNTTIPSLFLYNYACRYLIERVSWLLRDTKRQGKIILSARGTSRDRELTEYINTRLLPSEFTSISDRFTSVICKSASDWDLLQLADVCATSMFYYHEPNRYGFITPCYVFPLEKHLYRYNNKIKNYGVKYLTDEMKPTEQYFKEKMICEQ